MNNSTAIVYKTNWENRKIRVFKNALVLKGDIEKIFEKTRKEYYGVIIEQTEYGKI